MDRKQALKVKAGDWLEPLELWNATTHLQKLEHPTEVLHVSYQSGCQTGVLFLVRFLNGTQAYLDAGWFNAPNAQAQGRAEGASR